MIGRAASIVISALDWDLIVRAKKIPFKLGFSISQGGRWRRGRGGSSGRSNPAGFPRFVRCLALHMIGTTEDLFFSAYVNLQAARLKVERHNGVMFVSTLLLGCVPPHPEQQLSIHGRGCVQGKRLIVWWCEPRDCATFTPTFRACLFSCFCFRRF